MSKKDQEIEKLKMDKAKLRMALGFYANPNNYEDANFWTVVTDEGRTARRVPEETER